MRVIVIGDIHGNYKALEFIQQQTNADLYIQVGDLSVKNGLFPLPSKPLLFIHGNTDNINVLSRYHNNHNFVTIARNLFYLPSGNICPLGGLTIAGMGGSFSPKYYYHDKKKLEGRKRRHYTHEDYQLIADMANGVDILLTHEASSPLVSPSKFKGNRGRSEITKLILLTKPIFHFFGHHNLSTCTKIFDTYSRGIPNRSYIEVEL